MDLLKNEHILKINQILREVGEKVEGNLVCDISADNIVIKKFIKKINNIRRLVKGKKKVCEIGVNACHSLVIMIMENPDAEYLLFDLNNHKYTEPCLEYIRNAFPYTKINAVFGDSTKTMAEYIENNKEELNTFDLIHLDGGHTHNVFSQDYMNSKKLIKKEGVIIFDDYNFKAINIFINDKLKKKQIKEFKMNGLEKTNHHFIYQYI